MSDLKDPFSIEQQYQLEMDRMVAEVKEFWRGEAERQREKYVR